MGPHFCPPRALIHDLLHRSRPDLGAKGEILAEVLMSFGATYCLLFLEFPGQVPEVEASSVRFSGRLMYRLAPLWQLHPWLAGFGRFSAPISAQNGPEGREASQYWAPLCFDLITDFIRISC